jgi:hypothetical protein
VCHARDDGKIEDISGLLATQSGARAFLEHARKGGYPGAWIADVMDKSRSQLIFNEEGAAEMGKRVYVVLIDMRKMTGTVKDPSESWVERRLVRAETPAQAERYVTKNSVSAEYAEQEVLAELIASGVSIEEAGE